jgi:L-ascorbate metabolism protein UlaG (beta-lactamase superfamily)
LIAALASGCVTARAVLAPGDNFADGRFHNHGTFVEPTATKAEWARFVRRMLLRRFPDASKLPPRHVLSRDEVSAGLVRAEEASLAVTWIGHATALIRMGDQWILTDPVLTNSVGGGLIRLSRLVPPMPGLEELPPIDVIVISHADHDHLDLASLRRLARRNPEAAVYVPLGVGPLVRSAGFADVHELDWFQRTRQGSLSIQAVPAVHGVRRPPYRLNAMLWAGWIVEHGGDRVYFAGDTAFGSVFHEIRRRSGPVDLALVPIGGWLPRRIQKPFHVNPEEAAEIARIVGAKTAIGIHWGTLPLSEEAPREQRRQFLAAGGNGVETRVPMIGETMIFR